MYTYKGVIKIRLERRIAEECIKELKDELQTQLVIEMHDRELNARIEDVVNDYVEFFEEEEYDDILQESDRIIIRSLNKDKEITFERNKDDTGFILSAIKNYANMVTIPGNYVKYWDKETRQFDTKCPLKIENAQVIEVAKNHLFMLKREGFKLVVDDDLVIV